MAVRNGLPQSLATLLSVQGVCVLCIFQGLKGVSPDPSCLTQSIKQASSMKYRPK